jgi:hypothetical protein
VVIWQVVLSSSGHGRLPVLVVPAGDADALLAGASAGAEVSAGALVSSAGGAAGGGDAGSSVTGAAVVWLPQWRQSRTKANAARVIRMC